jgi:hypothetical protein
MEHQTAEDTTTGPPEPLGERGAFVADTVGPTPGQDPERDSGRGQNEIQKSPNPLSGH